MILYKKHQNEFLLPLFMGLMLMLINLVPIISYLNTKTTNTDSITGVDLGQKLDKISIPEKTEVAEVEVPILGGTNQVDTGVDTATAGSSRCASTPTPGVGQISVCGRVISLGYSKFTTDVSPPGGMALKYQYRNFIFGHNSADVFGGLSAILQPGDPIIVNYDGSAETYYFSYYAQNQSRTVIDEAFLPRNGSDALALMTCAPWVVDGLADSSRFGFIFIK